VIVALLAAVSFLPPDTSLAEVEEKGVLTACVPQSYPPLVTGDPANPGFDVSLLQAIAERMGLRLSLNVNQAMGKDFNPRNWRVNRAQCEVLAGGVIATTTTRSFLETLNTGPGTGWAMIIADPAGVREGMAAGVFPGLGGLDRVALTSALRRAGMRPVLATSSQAVEAGLSSGSYPAAIMESLGAGQLVSAHPEWQLAWVEGLERNSLALGLWKGDLTLKRRIVAALAELEAEGQLAQLQQRYGIVPIEQTVEIAQ
jgi:polar amino acid transport system substrate-binding protein/cystine transport system substrate-binding protein/membrane-bound lytic murein transglycosylase F